MKYKVGDKVRIRKDINLGKDDGVTLAMLKYAGEVGTIQDTDCDGCYYFKENIFAWTEDMIEGLVEDAQLDEAQSNNNQEAKNMLAEETIKLYTWQDLCDYEILQYEKWRIANEQRMEQERSVMHTLRQEYMEAIKRAMDKLGREVPASKAKELGFEV